MRNKHDYADFVRIPSAESNSTNRECGEIRPRIWRKIMPGRFVEFNVTRVFLLTLLVIPPLRFLNPRIHSTRVSVSPNWSIRIQENIPRISLPVLIPEIITPINTGSIRAIFAKAANIRSQVRQEICNRGNEGKSDDTRFLRFLLSAHV